MYLFYKYFFCFFLTSRDILARENNHRDQKEEESEMIIVRRPLNGCVWLWFNLFSIMIASVKRWDYNNACTLHSFSSMNLLFLQLGMYNTSTQRVALICNHQDLWKMKYRNNSGNLQKIFCYLSLLQLELLKWLLKCWLFELWKIEFVKNKYCSNQD